MIKERIGAGELGHVRERASSLALDRPVRRRQSFDNQLEDFIEVQPHASLGTRDDLAPDLLPQLLDRCRLVKTAIKCEWYQNCTARF